MNSVHLSPNEAACASALPEGEPRAASPYLAFGYLAAWVNDNPPPVEHKYLTSRAKVRVIKREKSYRWYWNYRQQHRERINEKKRNAYWKNRIRPATIGACAIAAGINYNRAQWIIKTHNPPRETVAQFLQWCREANIPPPKKQVVASYPVTARECATAVGISVSRVNQFRKKKIAPTDSISAFIEWWNSRPQRPARVMDCAKAAGITNSQAQSARENGAPRDSVENFVKWWQGRTTAKERQKSFRARYAAEALRLYDEGKSYKVIGKILGISCKPVLTILREHDAYEPNRTRPAFLKKKQALETLRMFATVSAITDAIQRPS